MLLIKNNSVETIQYKGVDKLISSLKKHYLACLYLINKKDHENISRAAKRFVKIEHSMINEVNRKFNIEEPIQNHLNVAQPLATISNYHEMYHSNVKLIAFLKSTIRQFNNCHMASFLSYWVAALQLENDEMEKHLKTK
ncbi:hypothetical protein L2735_11985 [Shewanella olleyana]|uniref:hypothetical protein n=1 Tax=Shewanella olleyana TaxID=135626 RepID=UPI00201076C1|nr:hypothetical protein [Shewanella olleyana]MCL1067518.1 hypothetical protein [Shewanella olleyana]